MLAVCEVCGKEFEYEFIGGRMRKFCSTKCANKRNNSRRAPDYWANRYANDSGYRERKKEANNAYAKRTRVRRKQEVFDQIIADVMGAKSEVEVRAILSEKMRVKAKFYA